MRLVRFEDPVDGSAVDLHPLLTVVTGAHPSARERLLRAVAALPRGADPGASGSVEVHGVMLDLTAESLGLLELHDDVDVILRAADLPGGALPDPRPDPSDRQAAARVAELRSELAEATRAAGQAAAAVDEAELLRAEVRNELADLGNERQRLAAQLAEATARLRPDGDQELAEARDALDELRHRRSESAVLALAAQRTALEAELERLIEQVNEHRRELRRLDERRFTAIRAVIAALADALDPELVPSTAALELAEELATLDDRLSMLETRAATGRAQLQELTARRDTAYDAFVAAEAALRSPELDESVVSELEGVHDEIFELDGRIAKLSAGRLRRRMLELRETEGQLLSQLGFESWSSYVAGISSEGAETERKRRYEVAKATYEFAEDEVAKAAAAPMAAASELADAQRRRRELLGKAEVILGEAVGMDPVAELRRHREPAVPTDLAATVDELRGLLSQAGAVGVPFDPAEAHAFAEAWVEDETAAGRVRAVEVEALRTRAEGEISRLADELAALPSEADLLEPLPDDHPDVVAAQARIDELAAALEAHREAEVRLGVLVPVDEEHARREAELQARRADAEHSVGEARSLAAIAEQIAADVRAALADLGVDDGSPDGERPIGGRDGDGPTRPVDGLEWYVLARLAQQRSLSFVGSVPLAIDDAFAEWSAEELGPVHARLARMSEVIQVVYVSDDVDVVAWARDLGRDRASVVDLSSS